jgi:hypothetical protein
VTTGGKHPRSIHGLPFPPDQSNQAACIRYLCHSEGGEEGGGRQEGASTGGESPCWRSRGRNTSRGRMDGGGGIGRRGGGASVEEGREGRGGREARASRCVSRVEAGGGRRSNTGRGVWVVAATPWQ